MSRADFYFHFAAHASSSGRPGWTSLSDADFRSTLTRVRSAVQLASESTPTWAEDLLTVARAVYMADKRALRARAADGWTRNIELAVEIIEPGSWDGEPLALLNRVLQVMTGDRWTVSLRGGARPLDVQPRLCRMAC